MLIYAPGGESKNGHPWARALAKVLKAQHARMHATAQPMLRLAGSSRDSVKLGYKTFAGGNEAVEFFQKLMVRSTQNHDLNEYEYLILLDLLKKGHPAAAAKIGVGLKGIQVRDYKAKDYSTRDSNARAFYVIRKDGSSEDFSYLKCCNTLFPAEVGAVGNRQKRSRDDDGGRGGRGRGGRGGSRTGPRTMVT
eukprot:gene3899-13969_t